MGFIRRFSSFSHRLLSAVSLSLLFPAFLSLCIRPVSAGNSTEHIVEKGETALQIALDHNLTMDQLQQLNPGTNLEMMMIGDKLIVPADPNQTYDDFIASYYGDMLETTSFSCERIADASALCLGELTNRTDSPVTNIGLTAVVRDVLGNKAEGSGGLATVQIEARETLPFVLPVFGSFGDLSGCSLSVTQMETVGDGWGSFRINEAQYTVAWQLRPAGTAADLEITFLNSFSGKKVNILAAAYDAEGTLIGVRSMYTVYRNKVLLDLYSLQGQIASVRTVIEVYPL